MADVTDDYVLVVGNSHVRSFATCPAFLPIFMGPGREFSFFDDEVSQSILERITELIATVGKPRTVLFVLSEPEIRFALAEAGGRVDHVDGEFPAAVARRYLEFLVGVRGATSSNLAVLGSIPRADEAYCRLASRVNAALLGACRSAGIHFIDLWPDCIDPKSGALRPELDADGIHLTFAASPIVARKLKSLKLLSHSAPERCDDRLAARHEFKLPSGNLVRVWGDLRLADPSSAQAAAAFGSRLGEALLPCIETGEHCFVVGAEDGFLAFYLAQRGTFRITAVEGDEARRSIASRLAYVFKRVAPVRVSAEIPIEQPKALVVLAGPMVDQAQSWLRDRDDWPDPLLLPGPLWGSLSACSAAKDFTVAESLAPGNDGSVYVLLRRNPAPRN